MSLTLGWIHPFLVSLLALSFFFLVLVSRSAPLWGWTVWSYDQKIIWPPVWPQNSSPPCQRHVAVYLSVFRHVELQHITASSTRKESLNAVVLHFGVSLISYSRCQTHPRGDGRMCPYERTRSLPPESTHFRVRSHNIMYDNHVMYQSWVPKNIFFWYWG